MLCFFLKIFISPVKLHIISPKFSGEWAKLHESWELFLDLPQGPLRYPGRLFCFHGSPHISLTRSIWGSYMDQGRAPDLWYSSTKQNYQTLRIVKRLRKFQSGTVLLYCIMQSLCLKTVWIIRLDIIKSKKIELRGIHYILIDLSQI